jgi:hypothetical protein
MVVVHYDSGTGLKGQRFENESEAIEFMNQRIKEGCTRVCIHVICWSCGGTTTHTNRCER